ncbi:MULTISPECIES: LamG domain-containing protein [Amycolatopsis]|nr:LamG domain-containing protein [Amycolatopsis bullii]
MASLILIATATTTGFSGDGSPRGPRSVEEPHRIAQASDDATAMRAARAQGTRVEVLAERTETVTVYANPDGTHTSEMTAVPTRVKKGAEWVAIDTTLQARPDGTVAPRAGADDVTLSGGGAGALIRLRSGPAELALRWPGGLPRPVLHGNEATYHDVLPGVDLMLRAEVRGYSQLLLVKDAAAARNLALVRISFPVEARGVRLTAEDSGALRAVDDAGRPVFQSPPSVMWDSSRSRREAPVGVKVAGDLLNLVPDKGFLADPATVYPVAIDPTQSPMAPTAWATVVGGHPDQSYWGHSADDRHPEWAQVGQCYRAVPDECKGIGEAWSYFRFNTQDMLRDKPVLSAKFYTKVAYSPSSSCGQTHQLHWVYQDIGSGLTFRNKPEWDGQWKDFPAPCTGAGVEVNLDRNSLNGTGFTTFYLRAANGNDQNAWRKYYVSAETLLQATWNRSPNTPTNLSTDPPLPQPCRWCAGKPYVSNDSIGLIATLSDPDSDNIYPKWWVTIQGGAPVLTQYNPGPSGAARRHDVQLGDDLNGLEVSWSVQAHDTEAESAAVGLRPFVVDRVSPTVRPTVAGALYKEDNRWHGGAGVPGSFTFGPGTCPPPKPGDPPCDVKDIDHYLYGWQDTPSTWVDAGALGGTATVSTAPPGDGPQALRVQSVDRAGNRSPILTSHVYVRAGSGSLGQWSFEGKPTDSAFLGDRHGTLNGNASYTTGAVGTAIQLDGNADSTVTMPPAFPTESSFSVSAWVRPDRLTSGMAALSQDGENTSSWWLSYDNAANRWSFLVGEKDQRMWGVTNQKAVPVAGEWTHLTGVYDRQARELRLYVNGSQVERQAADFAAAPSTGVITVGRLKWNTQFGVPWAGAVDEVQVFDRPLSDAEVGAMVSRDNVRTGHWRFDDDRLGAAARNSVTGGADLTLSGGAQFVDNGALGKAVRLDGASGQAATAPDRPVVHTDRSFSVTAWVTPRVFPTGQYDSVTAVSQDGAANSGFYLQRHWSGKWMFMKAGTDRTDNAEWVGAGSISNASLNVPVHLTGVYDATARELTIYVNGERGYTAKLSQPAWDATGPLVVGRAKSLGNPGDFFNGQVDEVRTYNRALAAEEIQAIVSQSDVPAGSWKLDGNANDSSGNNRNGTAIGSAQWTDGQSKDPDPADKALRLNGSNAVTTQNAVNSAESYTVAAWVKLDSVNCQCTVVSQDATYSNGFSLSVGRDSRGLPTWVMFAGSGDRQGANPLGTYLIWGEPQAGVWTHVAAVYNKQRGRIELYINGVLIGQTLHTGAINATGPLQIGRTKWWSVDPGNPYVNYFVGALDDVKVYPRALFADEIRAMAGRDPSLVHNWQLNEAGGTQAAADSVGVRGATLPPAGASFGPGRAGGAITLSGASAVSTSGVDLRTDQSFTVSAWVKLTDPGGCGGVCASTAVSLDGGAANPSTKFRLGHRIDPIKAPGPRGKWVFGMTPRTSDEENVAAISVNPGEFNTWMLLVGVYDAASKKIELYVYSDIPGDEPDYATGTVTVPWHGSGGLQIGRGTNAVDGRPGEYWKGAIDDVRLYNGNLDAARLNALYKSYPAVTS